ncbi:hypothetical protein [Novosphingobium guangzhouense]|uniref:hypothetical protein n=1 Tax=Novosphingobium guangzhouense TaxID=1850347 RepID=UPI00147512F6|nr:hypothetical protein [Novosphingobium guangzhouense]
MTVVEATTLADSEAEAIIRADLTALGIEPADDEPDVWAIMFAALEAAIEAHKPR